MVTEFITRIELHGGSEEEYLRLHQYMDANGFKKTILGGALEYTLPRGEYHLVKNLAAEEVMSLAKSAASKTGKRFSIIVSEVSNILTHGLNSNTPRFFVGTN